MAEYLIQGETLDNIANAINAKTGGSSAMTPAEMVEEIAAIPSGGVANLLTGTFTLSSGSVHVELACDFEPDYIIILGNLTEDVSLWGVRMLWIVRDDEAIMFCDTSQTGLNMSHYGANSISDLNGASTTANVPSAIYANNVLTVGTHGNRAYTSFCPGVEYRYFLYAS